MNNLEKRKNQLRNMKQNKNLSEEDLIALAQSKIDEENIISNLSFCINDDEKKYASELLSRYLSQSSFENESDKELLKQLIDQHLLTERFKSILKTDYNKSNPAQSIDMVDQLDRVVDRIIKLQEKLGLSNKDKEQDNLAEILSSLKKKAIKYYEEHAGCNVVKCPYCQNMFYLLLRTEQLTPEKCKMFKGTVLYNRPLMELIEKEVLTKEKVAEILGVNVLYISKIYDSIYLKEKVEDDRKN